MIGYSFLIRYCRRPHKCAIHFRWILACLISRACISASHDVISNFDECAAQADPIDGGRGWQLHDDVCGSSLHIEAVFAVECARVEDLLSIDDLVDLLPEGGPLDALLKGALALLA